MHFIRKIVARIAAQALGVASEDHPVKHERVHWEQWTILNNLAIDLRVAIGDPALAIRTHAREAVVFATTPDRIGVEQPEWRRICSRREVDVEVRFLRAQFTD